MAQIKNYTGTIQERRGGWWALCDQLPVSAHGESYNQALQNMIESIEQYTEALEGSAPPQAQQAPRGPGMASFEITTSVP